MLSESALSSSMIRTFMKNSLVSRKQFRILNEVAIEFWRNPVDLIELKSGNDAKSYNIPSDSGRFFVNQNEI